MNRGALAEASKNGYLYILNRETGQPVHPIKDASQQPVGSDRLLVPLVDLLFLWVYIPFAMRSTLILASLGVVAVAVTLSGQPQLGNPWWRKNTTATK